MQLKSKTTKASSQPRNNDLLFITDVNLRKKIESASLTIAGLYLLEKDNKIPQALSTEVRRIIILYAASIIEAIFLYVYKKNQFSHPRIEYVQVTPLPNAFQPSTSDVLIIAKQVRKERLERELMLDVLLKVFISKNVIKPNLAQKIERVKNIRNTFHLSKSRRNIYCSKRQVNEANDAIIETIKAIRTYVKK